MEYTLTSIKRYNVSQLDMFYNFKNFTVLLLLLLSLSSLLIFTKPLELFYCYNQGYDFEDWATSQRRVSYIALRTVARNL